MVEERRGMRRLQPRQPCPGFASAERWRGGGNDAGGVGWSSEGAGVGDEHSVHGFVVQVQVREKGSGGSSIAQPSQSSSSNTVDGSFAFPPSCRVAGGRLKRVE